MRIPTQGLQIRLIFQQTTGQDQSWKLKSQAKIIIMEKQELRLVQIRTFSLWRETRRLAGNFIRDRFKGLKNNETTIQFFLVFLFTF